MFEEFFGMKHTPFSNQIPAEALYLSDNLQEGIGRLCYVAAARFRTEVSTWRCKA